jgi:microcystin-dependent protein
MSDPFLSELRIFTFNFAPTGWAMCNGQLLPINQNQALFSLIGTFYGGNGTTNFALPNLQGRVPLHMGGEFSIGDSGGEESHTLVTSEMAVHNHTMNATAAQATVGPGGRVPGTGVAPAEAVAGSSNDPIPVDIYSSNAIPDLSFDTGSLGSTGGSEGHENRQPFLALNICIAIQGIFPSRS